MEKPIHPLWLRISHWLNASPLFEFRIPKDITLGGWLGGALQWHFAAMWLLAANVLIYVIMNLATGRLRAKLLPVRIRDLIADMKAALTGELVHADPRHYNAVQKAAYLFVTLDAIVLIVSGLVIWKSVQFPLLRDLLGGYEMARMIHFYATALLVLFFLVHIAMVAIVPRTFIAMLRGH